MIPAATSHSSIRIMSIVLPADFIGRRTSENTSVLVCTCVPGGGCATCPRTTTAVASGAPSTPSFCVSFNVTKSAGWPAKYVTPSTWPTTRKGAPPMMKVLPTPTPSETSVTASPADCTPRPLDTSGAPTPPGSTPTTPTSRNELDDCFGCTE